MGRTLGAAGLVLLLGGCAMTGARTGEPPPVVLMMASTIGPIDAAGIVGAS